MHYDIYQPNNTPSLLAIASEQHAALIRQHPNKRPEEVADLALNHAEALTTRFQQRFENEIAARELAQEGAD